MHKMSKTKDKTNTDWNRIEESAKKDQIKNAELKTTIKAW